MTIQGLLYLPYLSLWDRHTGNGEVVGVDAEFAPTVLYELGNFPPHVDIAKVRENRTTGASLGQSAVEGYDVRQNHRYVVRAFHPSAEEPDGFFRGATREEVLNIEKPDRSRTDMKCRIIRV